MIKIKAKGYISGKLCSVTVKGYENVKVETDSSYIEAMLNVYLEKPEKFAGTYHPEPYSILAAYNTLENHIFDKVVEIKVIGGEIPTIPWEPDVIY